jgi:hypothetical protein
MTPAAGSRRAGDSGRPPQTRRHTLFVIPAGNLRWMLPIPRYTGRRAALLALLCFGLTAPIAHAHIGSPDTFLQTQIGPYHALLAVHPPATSPGALELDLRFDTQEGLTDATAALDDRAPASIRLFPDGTATVSLWSVNASAHTLHIMVQGTRGPATLNLTIPATSTGATPPAVHRTLHTGLLTLGLLLAIAAVFVAQRQRRLSTPAFVLLAAALLVFAAAARLARANPSGTTLLAQPSADGHLEVTLVNPSENFADLVPDHGKLLHLFLVREPQHDVFLHLHPRQMAPGRFDAALPAMPPGTYTLFADFYHADGTGETAALRLTLPQNTHPATTDLDDSSAVLPPLSRPNVRDNATDDPRAAGTSIDRWQVKLPDGYSMQMLGPAQLKPLEANLFVVSLLDPTAHLPADMTPYLGMSAHAVVLRSDDQVFAHIHPGGTLPMLMPAASTTAPMTPTATLDPPGIATIPYGFPTPGHYRLFVQMKHGTRVETGAFDLTVN